MPASPQLEMYVDGAWTTGAAADGIASLNPATGESLGRVPAGTPQDVERAVAAAAQGQATWARCSDEERAAYLRRVAEHVRSRRDELARTLAMEQGKPLELEAYPEVDDVVAGFEEAASRIGMFASDFAPTLGPDRLGLVYRVPRGVTAVITPWNFPYSSASIVIAPALACGNAVVWVPAPETPICAVRLAECIAEAEPPADIFQLVTGHGPVAGDALVGHAGVQAIAFTGSADTGRLVAARGAGKALLLELGGNGPMIVLEDADLDAAAVATMDAAFLCAGQSCTAGELFLVHGSVRDAFIERVVQEMARAVKLGDPLATGTTVGPLNNDAVAEKVERHVTGAVEAGARVVVGGGRASGWPTDLFFEPTVVDGVASGMEISREETFGPVIPIQPVDSADAAIEIANASRYGLASAIWTNDVDRGVRLAERMRSGWVNVNASTNALDGRLPFGGRAGSDSGLGRLGPSETYDFFTEPKTVAVTRPTRG